MRLIPRLLVALVALVACLLLGPGLLLGTPSASALSCVMPDQVVGEAKYLFTGRIVDSRGDRVRVEVERVRPGDRVAAEVWLSVEIGFWMPWLPGTGAELSSTEEHGVPEHYRDHRLWLFAADADWTVNACSAWVGDFEEMRLEPTLAGLTEPPTIRPASTVPEATTTVPTAAVPTTAEIGVAEARSGLSAPAMAWSALGGLVLGALVLGGSLRSSRH